MIPKSSLFRTTVLYLIALAAAILYPYEFGWPPGNLIDQFSLGPELAPSAPLKTAAHVLVFLPLGIIVGWATVPTGPWLSRTAVGVIALVAVGSELAQVFVESRTASIQDLLADIVGVVLGLWLARLAANRDRDSQPSTKVELWRMSLAGLPVVLVLALLIVLEDVDFFGWDPNYLLLLGNENTLDRPWSGEIYEIAFFDEALTPEDVRALAKAKPASYANSLHHSLASYSFATQDLEYDELGLRNVLETTSPTSNTSLRVVEPRLVRILPGGGIGIERGGTLRSEVAPVATYEAVQQSKALTVMVDFMATDPEAAGPARILSASLNPDFRNLTIGQQDKHLVYRIRNRVSGPNGTKLQIESEECLRLGERQRLVAVSNTRMTRLFTNGQPCAEIVYTLFPHASRLFGPLELTSPMKVGRMIFGPWFFLYLFVLVTLQWRRPWRTYREPVALVISGTAVSLLLSVDLVLS